MSWSHRQDRAAFAAVLSAMALVVLDAGMVNVALPTIARAFAATPSHSMMAVTFYQLALLIGLLPCAHLADRIGYRRLFIIGVALFGCSAVLSSLAPTLSLLVAARGLQGLGGAAIMSLGIALLRAALGPDRLGSAISWNALVVAVCSGLGPAVGAVLLAAADWRWLFLIPLPMAAIALLAGFGLPAVRATRRSVDLLSMFLFAVLCSCVVGAAHFSLEAPLTATGLAGGGLWSAYWLYIRQRGQKAPLVPIDLLALPPFRKSVVASVLVFTGQSGGLLALPFYLQLSLGRTATTAGLILALWPLAVAVTSRFANRLADRFGSETICAAGALVLAAGLAATAVWPVGQTVAPLAGSALVSGIGFGLFQVSNNRTMFLAAPANRSAAAGGLQGTARLAGQTAGALLVAAILSSAPMIVAPRLAIGLAAVAALLAAWVSWSREAQPCAAANISRLAKGRTI